jgi:hypothetical protein
VRSTDEHCRVFSFKARPTGGNSATLLAEYGLKLLICCLMTVNRMLSGLTTLCAEFSEGKFPFKVPRIPRTGTMSGWLFGALQ